MDRNTNFQCVMYLHYFISNKAVAIQSNKNDRLLTFSEKKMHLPLGLGPNSISLVDIYFSHSFNLNCNWGSQLNRRFVHTKRRKSINMCFILTTLKT